MQHTQCLIINFWHRNEWDFCCWRLDLICRVASANNKIFRVILDLTKIQSGHYNNIFTGTNLREMATPEENKTNIKISLI